MRVVDDPSLDQPPAVIRTAKAATKYPGFRPGKEHPAEPFDRLELSLKNKSTLDVVVPGCHMTVM
jgi:hypothetical protein